MSIYHVSSEWTEGEDLCSILALVQRGLLSEEDALAQVESRWPEMGDAGTYIMIGDGTQVHCYATLAEAQEHAEDRGGFVVEIDDETLDVRTGKEFPHPVVQGHIPAACCKRVA